MRHSLSPVNRSWFVRQHGSTGCNLRPSSRAGWLVTTIYALSMGAASLLLTLRQEPASVELVVWAILSVAMTVTFLLIAWRTSSPAAAAPHRNEKTSTAKRQLLVALLTAALIVGGALLGINL